MLLLIPLFVFSALSTAARSPEWAALDAPTRHVRAIDPEARHALLGGYRRSSTFASMVDRLQASDVVVYIDIVSHLPRQLRGGAQMVPGAAHQRYVWIDIASGATPDDTIAVVAHELQHALEIADAQEVVDQTSLDRLYGRIGTRSGPEMFETESAIDAEWQVKKELRIRGRAAPCTCA